MYKKLLNVYKQRQSAEIELNQKKNDFIESIALEQAQLNDLKDEENKLREEACLKLEQDGKDSESLNGKLICRQVKLTKKIADNYALADSIRKNLNKLGEIGIDAKSLIDNAFETVIEISDKKAVGDAIDKFEKVEGKLLDGVEIQTTKFITIRDE